MLNVFVADPRGCLVKAEAAPTDLPAGAVWIDLVSPSPNEERQVEALLGVGVPTREEMQEIEVSSRLYEENGALYMTATVVSKADTAAGGVRRQLHSGRRSSGHGALRRAAVVRAVRRPLPTLARAVRPGRRRAGRAARRPDRSRGGCPRADRPGGRRHLARGVRASGHAAEDRRFPGDCAPSAAAAI